MGFWEWLFFANVGLLAYVYLGYPLAVLVMGLLRRREVPLAAGQPAYEPTATVVIAAFNEADSIVQTVRNKLDLAYPASKLDVIVVSDGSEDGTDDLVRGIDDPRVTLLRQEPRAGKTSALNLAIARSTSEVIVFSDANSFYAPDALLGLMAALADPRVGYVTGRMVYKAANGSLTGKGCSTYMKYENALRWWENRLGSIVGVDGGIDAMRRELYRPMRPDQQPDFVQPLSVREQGYRVVYAPEARVFEDALAESRSEFKMRLRVALRAWHALKDKAGLLNPFRYGVFAWQLFSHKVLRYLGFVFQIFALVPNIVLVARHSRWEILLAGQALFYLLAMIGFLGQRRSLPGIITAAYYLCLVNLSAGVAFGRFLLGQKQVLWQPRH